MRRSHQETQELVAARRRDFLEGNATEAVFLASLKSLGLNKEDRERELAAAIHEWIAKAKKGDDRMQRSQDWINTYLKR